MRAASLQKNPRLFRICLNEARALIDLSLQDHKWNVYKEMLSGFRGELEKFYSGERTDDISVLYRAL